MQRQQRDAQRGHAIEFQHQTGRDLADGQGGLPGRFGRQDQGHAADAQVQHPQRQLGRPAAGHHDARVDAAGGLHPECLAALETIDALGKAAAQHGPLSAAHEQRRFQVELQLDRAEKGHRGDLAAGDKLGRQSQRVGADLQAQQVGLGVERADAPGQRAAAGAAQRHPGLLTVQFLQIAGDFGGRGHPQLLRRRRGRQGSSGLVLGRWIRHERTVAAPAAPATNRSVDQAAVSGQGGAEFLKPGLGQVADFGIVEQDALHDARLDLLLGRCEPRLGRDALELGDQQGAGAFELDDGIPVAAAGGHQHVVAGPFDGFVIVQQGLVHVSLPCRPAGSWPAGHEPGRRSHPSLPSGW
mmetsp:Transcript_70443/g.165928  ORF Transcript_70443/g.165928 Transcript_70443/m.165928 type:complete len:355 (-) Transcript_70443:4000-5064(-)